VDVAARTGARAVTVEEAARAKDVVIIAVPQRAVEELPWDILGGSKAVILDAGNYYPSRDGVMADIEEGLIDSMWVSRVVGRPVVKAFNNIGAESLATRGRDGGEPERIALSMAGNDLGMKEVVMGLIDSIGFDAIDGGSLAESWR